MRSSSWSASSDAKKITVHKDENEKGQTVTIEYKEIGELPVDAIVTIRCPANEALTYWNLQLKNGTKSWIGHVQFPVIEVPFDNPTEGDPSYILSSSLDGSLAGPVEPAVYQRPGWTRHTPLERQWGGTESITPDIVAGRYLGRKTAEHARHLALSELSGSMGFDAADGLLQLRRRLVSGVR